VIDRANSFVSTIVDVDLVGSSLPCETLPAVIALAKSSALLSPTGAVVMMPMMVRSGTG
jgi:hypothetical protein